MPFVKSQEESLRSNGVETDHFILRHSGLIGYAKSLPELKNKIKSGNFDIIHAHYGYSGWLAILTFSGLPVVVSLMGTDVYGPVQTGSNCFKCRLEIFLTKLLQLFVDRIIVKSKNLYNDLYKKQKASIIPNGVNFQKFQPKDKYQARKRLNLPPNKQIILFLGHPTYIRKNFALLEEAVRLENNPKWQILNPYPTNPQNIPDFINASDVLVLTSLKEGSPNVIKEAMACNRPIVSTDVGDVKEIIENTRGCYLTSFEPSDVAKKINKAIQFGDETNGREEVSHLEINKVAQSIISIYRQVLKTD